MPLFLFKCPKCLSVIEKLVTSGKDHDILCDECGEKCEKEISVCFGRTSLDAKTLYNEKILPDAKRINDQIAGGNDDVFFDICGE
ncbi:MAG: zinc ribbon domain-containing protein [Patescibacteria group bacterium]